jgi:cytoskeletal protein RodZ
MSTASRSLFRIRYRTIIMLMVVAIILWSGFSYWTEYSDNAARRARELLAPPLGVECSIELAGTELPSVVGTITDQSERWLVVQPSRSPDTPTAPTNAIWIPRERILTIEVIKR